MIRVVVALTVCVLMLRCADERTKGVIDMPAMTEVMWDVLRADELSEYNKIQDTSFSSFSKRSPYYNRVLKIHKINQKTFRQSLEYYEARPELLQEIIDSLTQRADRANKQHIADTAQKQRTTPPDTAALKKIKSGSVR